MVTVTPSGADSECSNWHFDPAGHILILQGIQRPPAHDFLALLYKAKKKPALALQHLTEAQRIIFQFGQTPMLARIDAALAELG